MVETSKRLGCFFFLWQRLWLKALGRKGFVWLTNYSSSSGEAKAESWRQEPEHKSHRNIAYCLLPMACSSCFLIQPKTTCPEVVQLTVGCPNPNISHHQENVPLKLHTSQSDGGNYSIEISQICRAFCQVDKKQLPEYSHPFIS